MWQSQVEIEHYSIAYFDRATAFKALQHRTSVKGRAHTHYVDLSGIHAYICCMYELHPKWEFCPTAF